MILTVTSGTRRAKREKAARAPLALIGLGGLGGLAGFDFLPAIVFGAGLALERTTNMRSPHSFSTPSISTAIS
ncbi:hypothetical protein XFF7766_280052 [Xanthomonas citri pv. fuscans]|nr:hypothetical protein XFF7766_280052 [Xanthomonas citri pv. fuscans]